MFLRTSWLLTVVEVGWLCLSPSLCPGRSWHRALSLRGPDSQEGLASCWLLVLLLHSLQMVLTHGEKAGIQLFPQQAAHGAAAHGADSQFTLVFELTVSTILSFAHYFPSGPTCHIQSWVCDDGSVTQSKLNVETGSSESRAFLGAFRGPAKHLHTATKVLYCPSAERICECHPAQHPPGALLHWEGPCRRMPAGQASLGILQRQLLLQPPSLPLVFRSLLSTETLSAPCSLFQACICKTKLSFLCAFGLSLCFYLA